MESKKTASLQEISSVSGFLCKLLNGMVVTGFVCITVFRRGYNRYATIPTLHRVSDNNQSE